MKIAVLITSYNRREKTMACLHSLYSAEKPLGFAFDVFLVDDGSTDGTSIAVRNTFHEVRVINGSGNLFWAGGMRLAWNTAMESRNYDAFLLLNDDVAVESNLFLNFLDTFQYCNSQLSQDGIYVGATKNALGKLTYTGHTLASRLFRMRMEKLVPGDLPKICDLANANILFVTKNVVDQLGILDVKYTHGLADYDYTLLASSSGIPVYVMPGFAGLCEMDHGSNWKPAHVPLKERIAYLYSPKGLAYKEYIYFIKKHCPSCVPYHIFMLWLKTIFPQFWERFKQSSEIS